MNKDQAIARFGSRMALAKALGIDNSTVTRWKQVPPWHQKTIESLTFGELKADSPVVKERGQTKKVCFTIPVDTMKMFKKLCRKQRLSMSEKVTELVEKDIILS